MSCFYRFRRVASCIARGPPKAMSVAFSGISGRINSRLGQLSVCRVDVCLVAAYEGTPLATHGDQMHIARIRASQEYCDMFQEAAAAGQRFLVASDSSGGQILYLRNPTQLTGKYARLLVGLTEE